MHRLVAVAALVPTFAAAAPPKLPPHYAALFELHHTWTYDVSLTTWDYDKMQGPGRHEARKTERAVVKCSVVGVKPFANTITSQVTCDRDFDRAFTVAGVYAADAAGLHGLSADALPETEADVSDLETPSIAARPKAVRTATKDDFFKATLLDELRKQGTAWCVLRDTSQFPDGGSTSICYDHGIVSGNSDIGGELHRVTWHLR